MIKQVMKSQIAGRIASWLIGAYITLVNRTTRWTFDGEDHLSAVEGNETGFILAFWHNRLLMAPTVRHRTRRRVFMLISAHRDGDIIANGVERFGIEFIRGSAASARKPQKHKSGAPALLQMIAALEGGAVVGMTPDGPKGPAQKAKPGALQLAGRTGAAILPSAYATSRFIRLNSWDRFFLPLPFARGAFVAMPPQCAPELGPKSDPGDLEQARQTLEASLDAAVAKAETMVGIAGD